MRKNIVIRAAALAAVSVALLTSACSRDEAATPSQKYIDARSLGDELTGDGFARVIKEFDEQLQLAGKTRACGLNELSLALQLDHRITSVIDGYAFEQLTSGRLPDERSIGQLAGSVRVAVALYVLGFEKSERVVLETWPSAQQHEACAKIRAQAAEIEPFLMN